MDLANTENLTISVKWAPNLASFVAAFCALCTYARQGVTADSRSRRQNLANLNLYLGARFGPPLLPSLPLDFSLQQRPYGLDLYQGDEPSARQDGFSLIAFRHLF
jgi:hypothetical protein